MQQMEDVARRRWEESSEDDPVRNLQKQLAMYLSAGRLMASEKESLDELLREMVSEIEMWQPRSTVEWREFVTHRTHSRWKREQEKLLTTKEGVAVISSLSFATLVGLSATTYGALQGIWAAIGSGLGILILVAYEIMHLSKSNQGDNT
jgi:hypothetical protein